LRGLVAYTLVVLLQPVLLGRVAASAEPSSIAARYQELCASCHGNLRYGGYAPPLIPATLGRKSGEELERAILQGHANTKMSGFADRVDAREATALVAFIRRPVETIRWEVADIAESRVEYPIETVRIARTVRRDNIILVVERGTGDVSVLDGDSMREVDRFEVGRVHGGPKFDRGYRKVIVPTRDGTLVEYDLERGEVRSRVKVAVNTRNVATSPEGDFVVAANQLPANLALLDGHLRPLRVFPLPGQPSGVYALPGARQFILTLRDVPLLYRISYPDLKMREVSLPEPFEDFVFVPGRPFLLASSRGGQRISLYSLESHSILGSVETKGLPHLFSACFFSHGGTLHAAVNHIGVPRLSIIEMDRFQIVKELPLRGSGFFVRTHDGTPYLWVDTDTDEIQLIHKETLTLLDRTLAPERGKKALHVEFTAEGDSALVSVAHEVGAVVIYDSRTLEETGRLPYAAPIGKYNAFNKTRLLR
jgi:hypothetical protein